MTALDGKVSLGSARRNFVASTQPSRQTPSAASGGTVLACRFGSCAPAGRVQDRRSRKRRPEPPYKIYILKKELPLRANTASSFKKV